MVWDAFIWFGSAAVLMSAGAALFALHGNRSWTVALSIMSVIALGSFIAVLWGSLGRPPLKTMGETRLWYSFFALLSGLFTYMRWRYKWILSFSTVLATVFIVINILKPEIHDQSLMPALQSPWFIPHVTVYMFSYSLLGCAFLIAVFGLFRSGEDMLQAADTLVYIGTAFLTFGMLSGAIWAKAAWGHYWSWDPKETWALATWLSYLLYMHLRITGKGSGKALCLLLVFSFLCLQMCWWGVNYLPSAQDSIHVYNR
ncbi:MAG: cytochrome c biogenesis protein CcsA [Bacteroidales bacterium]|nr:cytochrome c biogenesis protein CcsA [Bacteroidales bacterium]